MSQILVPLPQGRLPIAAAKYPDPPNFCHRRKSAGKITAAEFVKFGEPRRKNFG